MDRILVIRVAVILAGLMLCGWASPAAGEVRTTIGDLRTHATNHCISVELDIAGDSNHNASCRVKFRAKGSRDWRKALDLFRTDYRGWWHGRRSIAKRAYNMLAGSILFLKPGVEYEVQLDLSDPDGGTGRKYFLIRTRPWPVRPKGGKTHHIRDSRQIAEVQKAANPGDTIMLHRGSYGTLVIDKPGKPGRRILWTAAEDGVVFDLMRVRADHVWIDGMNLVRATKTRHGLCDLVGARDVVVTRNSFKKFPYSISLARASRDWHIMDNTIVGDRIPGRKAPEGRGAYSGEGIELAHSEGHTVCYNSITHVADGISYSDRNCDIFGNNIFDVTDDAIEPDYGYSNVRIWGNRMANSGNFHISFQPMFCGPWYIIRNLAVGRGYPFKFNGPVDRFLLANNTFICPKGIINSQILLNAISRNNLFIKGLESGPLLNAKPWTQRSIGVYMPPNNFKPTWKTDVDYDGFDWGSVNKSGIIYWENKSYENMVRFAWSVGIEKHAIRVFKENIFTQSDLRPMRLPLRKGCAAIDAGVVLHNINDNFKGKAPDLGAYEFGHAEPHYGPRRKDQVESDENYWVHDTEK